MPDLSKAIYNGTRAIKGSVSGVDPDSIAAKAIRASLRDSLLAYAEDAKNEAKDYFDQGMEEAATRRNHAASWLESRAGQILEGVPDTWLAAKCSDEGCHKDSVWSLKNAEGQTEFCEKHFAAHALSLASKIVGEK